MSFFMIVGSLNEYIYNEEGFSLSDNLSVNDNVWNGKWYVLQGLTVAKHLPRCTVY